MSAERPVQLRLTSQRHLRWMLLPAAIIALVPAAVWLSVTFPGEADDPEAGVDWSVPLLGLGGTAVVVLLLWAGTVALWRARERRGVLRVVDHVLARWPQFSTEAQWQKVIAENDEPAVRKADVVIPAVIVTAVVLRLIRTPWHRFLDLLRNDHRAREVMPVSVTCIRVPPGHEGEAVDVALEIGQRWLGSGALS